MKGVKSYYIPLYIYIYILTDINYFLTPNCWVARYGWNLDTLSIGNEKYSLISMGVPKIEVTALEPLGCLPPFTASSSFQNCSTTWNSVSHYHNQILQEKIEQNLNNPSEKYELVVLDFHSSFMSAFKVMQKINDKGNLTSENNPMKPFCVGIGNGFSSGSVDKRGAKKYSLCKEPELSFFWDMIHPSQSGWHAGFSELLLHSSLYKLVN
ncbi:hypothetical protein UlMin_025489 [Ulmus minor]